MLVRAPRHGEGQGPDVTVDVHMGDDMFGHHAVEEAQEWLRKCPSSLVETIANFTTTDLRRTVRQAWPKRISTQRGQAYHQPVDGRQFMRPVWLRKDHPCEATIWEKK